MIEGTTFCRIEKPAYLELCKQRPVPAQTNFSDAVPISYLSPFNGQPRIEISNWQ